MTSTKIYEDIAKRSKGEICLGVVGPVRSGKSTLIQRFMETLVLPNLADENEAARARDEMPQSAGGKTVMTTEPKFVPKEAAKVVLQGGVHCRIRLCDCVGFLIPGALGEEEDGQTRMVHTPWQSEPIPFAKAAYIGTEKVIKEHATVGILVTSDGSIGEFPRSAYEEAEERVVSELKALGKPFAVVLNSTHPAAPETRALEKQLTEKYAVPVTATDVLNLQKEQLDALMEGILFEFPLTEVRLNAPAWVTSLSREHWLGGAMLSAVEQAASQMHRVRDHQALKDALMAVEYVEDASPGEIRLSEGRVEYRLTLKDGLFLKILGETCGAEIADEEHLFRLMEELVHAKKEYDRVADALDSVRRTGYGLVSPAMSEMTLEKPELVKQGSRFGVRLKASAPSLHLIRVDIQTEVSPIVGTEKQSEELRQYLLSGFEGDASGIWETEIFGKSLNDLVREGLSTKLMRMPDDVRMNIQSALSKIINEGSGGMICILL